MDFADGEWECWDNSFFADLFEFNEEEAKTITRSTPITLRKKNVESSEINIGENDVGSEDIEKT